MPTMQKGITAVPIIINGASVVGLGASVADGAYTVVSCMAF